MRIFISIVFVEIVAIFLTVVGCRIALMRRHQPGWYIAILGAVGVAVLVMFWENGNLLFDPSQWSANKRSLSSLISEFVTLIAVSIVPALIVVRYYRKKVGKDENKVV